MLGVVKQIVPNKGIVNIVWWGEVMAFFGPLSGMWYDWEKGGWMVDVKRWSLQRSCC